MHAWDNPTDPDPRPIDDPDTPDNPGGPRDPGERPPFDEDPGAQRAPGSEDDAPGGGPPMQAIRGDEPPPDEDVIYLDGPGAAREPVGNDNIREGRVGGVMGTAHPSNGQGQGG